LSNRLVEDETAVEVLADPVFVDEDVSDRFLGLATGASPFDPSKLTKRADRAWRNAGLERITLHECRHTFASLMIVAGVNAKALQPTGSGCTSSDAGWR
jgi:integrase